jgi:transposase
MMPGMPERRTHDYARHGTTSLFAAFNIADGTVISELRRKHRSAEYLKFLRAIDKAVPVGLDVHIVCDNLATHKTPAVNEWIARHPRFHVHFTPTGSSWINQVPVNRSAVHGPALLHAERHRPPQPQGAVQHDPPVHHLAQQACRRRAPAPDRRQGQRRLTPIT